MISASILAIVGGNREELWILELHLMVIDELVLHLEMTVLHCNVFYNVIYSCDGKAEFSASSTTVFSVT